MHTLIIRTKLQSCVWRKSTTCVLYSYQTVKNSQHVSGTCWTSWAFLDEKVHRLKFSWDYKCSHCRSILSIKVFLFALQNLKCEMGCSWWGLLFGCFFMISNSLGSDWLQATAWRYSKQDSSAFDLTPLQQMHCEEITDKRALFCSCGWFVVHTSRNTHLRLSRIENGATSKVHLGSVSFCMNQRKYISAQPGNCMLNGILFMDWKANWRHRSFRFLSVSHLNMRKGEWQQKWDSETNPFVGMRTPSHRSAIRAAYCVSSDSIYISIQELLCGAYFVLQIPKAI